MAQNAVQTENDVVLVAAVSPEQQNEFVGMTAEQLMQLDLYFVPGGETPATPQSGAPTEPESSGGESVCPEGVQDTSIFGALEPSAEEGASIVAAADPNAPIDEIQQFQGQGQENPDSSDACVGDLTELSLLELMSVRVAAEPTPVLPQLQPVDLDTLFDRADDTENNNRENLNEDTNEDTFFPPVPDPVDPLPPFNVSPIAGNDKYAIGEDGTLSVVGSGVLKNDTDGNGDLLSVSLATGPSNGTLTLNPNGRFTYVPNANFNGKDSFTYQVSDGNGGFDVASVTLTVTAVNDAPVLTAPASIAVTEDTAVTISGISVTDVDVGTGVMTVTLAVPSGGLSATTGGGVTVTGSAASLTLSGTLADINAFLGGSNVTYTPALNNEADVNLTVTVNDKGNTGAGGAKADSSVVNLDLQPVNDAPVAGDDTFTTKEDTFLSGTVTANDSDVDGGALVYSLVGGPIVGLTFNPDGTFSYTPPLNSNGPVTFDYQVDDGKGGTDTATVTINVTPVNDAPVAGDDTFTTIEDTPFSDTVAANDSDVDGDSLTYSLVGGPVAGLTFNSDGTFSYAPPLNSNGTVNFTYLVSDGKGGSDTATVTINVTPVNDPPVAGDDSFTTKEDTTLNSKVSTNDIDVDGDTLTYSLVGAPIAGLTFNPDGTFSYAPPLNSNGIVTFDYQVDDGKGGTDTATATITVTPVKDAPVAGDDVFTTTEDTPFSSTVATNDSDVDGDSLTYTLVGGPVAGLTLHADGSFDYTPPLNSNGSVIFTYQVADGKGGTDTGTATITVDPVNDAPVAVVPPSISVIEDVPSDIIGISFNDVDAGANDVVVTLSVSAGTLTALTGGFVIVGGSGTNTITLTGPISAINSYIASGSVDFTTPLDSNTNATLTVSINDQGNSGAGGAQTDSESVTLIVTPVNDAPVAGDDTFTTNEDTPFGNTVAANDSDVDGGTLTYSLVGGPVAGLTLNADGSFNYAPPLNSNGPVTFTYLVSDGKGGTDTATATINVTAVNDAPVAGDDSFTTKEDTALNSKVSTNDSDVDGDTLTYALVGSPIAGLTFNPDGTFSYVPPLNSNGVVTFDYQVDDGKGGTDTATATINVTPVNDAPTAITLDSNDVDEETPGEIIGNLNVADPDIGDTHTFTVDDARFVVIAGTLQLASGVSLDFESEPTVTIQVTAKDTGGLTHTESFVVVVNDTAGISDSGTDGADTLTGGDQDDTLSGGKDADILDGGAGSDSLDGGDDIDILDGGAGSDTLDGGAGNDGISGGDGNDLIIFDPADISGINGGNGIDTLAVLNGADIDFNLAPISSIEVINMVDGKANVVTLTALDVLAISETGTMTIAGESGDTVMSGGGWSGPVSDGNGNNIYTQLVGANTATLIVDQDVTFV
ncbi:MAG TPA: Ig-like domain-containing protein [Verrucomicrobiae bacterium]|nr:Ig-like domain-containing protein [Verrucomicrobiae bacterium]